MQVEITTEMPANAIEVEVKKEIPGLPDLQNTFYHKDLTCLYVPSPVGSGQVCCQPEVNI